ncbi:MAG: hypothetical protein KatS3mg077_0838 [Candidatus Binatia bacterium]|nr:MAG: hypothetical protein KatS3mg077_0838 [Candidatus Binatia bacterium]
MSRPPSPMGRRLWLAAVVAGSFVGGPAALGHDRTHSYSTWRFEGAAVQVTVRLAELDTTHFEWGVYPQAERDRALAEYLLAHIRLVAGDKPCTPLEAVRTHHPGAGRLAVSWSLQCAPAAPLRLRADVLFDVIPTHLHFVRVEGLGPKPEERVLTATQREWVLATGKEASQGSAPSGFLDYVLLGIEHIASGYDHLAFVIALILLGGSFASLAKVITAFTLAHSVTLALSVSGWLRPEAAAVEALIGFSIAMVATENLWLRTGHQWGGVWLLSAATMAVATLSFLGVGRIPPLVATGVALFALSFFGLAQWLHGRESPRWGVAFLFGLVHGFGFASVLLDVGLAPAALAVALAGFNIGVELGQLAVVALAWPALRWLEHRRPAWSGWVVDGTSAVVLALGTYWYLSRTYG